MSFSRQCLLQPDWVFSGEVVEKAKRNVVVIKFTHMYPFDGEFAETSEATGFVINAKKGFVVTNRHVAGPGPFWGWCIFNRKEEAPCRPLYIDPIHDFAVLQYELSAIRYTHIDGLDLCPTRALCDQSVLIFGNNGGEEISQHHGSVTLVERNAPEYTDGYRDFNISYYQINVNLSGGISGSPALSADGSVLGIVSGARTDCASVSFVLPSTAIVKALKYLVRGQAVPRGDIRCRFRLTPLYECRGLGLSRDWEDKLRKELPNRDELLVADRVLSNGPAYGKILPGDIILDVNKVCVDNFEKLADILNQKVEQTVLVGLLRETEIMHAEIAVKNLDTIPDRLVRVGEMFCHDLSLVLAVRHGVPVEGVYVAESREPTMIGDGCPDYIIQSINGRELRNVDDFLASLQEFRQGQSVTLICAHLESIQKSFSSVITLDVPSGITVVFRGPSWKWEVDYFHLDPCLAPMPNFHSCSNFPNLVHIESRSHIYLDGFQPRVKRGLGVVVDAERGLIAVSGLLVPHRACHITIAYGSSEVEGRCWFIHAQHWYTIIQYDVSLVPKCSVNLSKKMLAKGTQANLTYFPESEAILQDDAIVCSVQITEPNLHSRASSSRYQPINADLVGIDASSEIKKAHGIITDSRGSVSAIWMPSIGGIRMVSILNVLARLTDRLNPFLYVMPAEVEKRSILSIRKMGVPEEAMRSFQAHENMFIIKKTASKMLKNDDILLEVGGKVCTGWETIDSIRSHTISVKVLRQFKEKNLQLGCSRIDGSETSQCIEFCGISIQPPHLAMRHGLNQVPSEVYISHVQPGSPGDLCLLAPKAFITKIGGLEVTDFESFRNLIRELMQGSEIKVTVTTLNGCDEVRVLKVDNEHHGILEWEFDGSISATRPHAYGVDESY